MNALILAATVLMTGPIASVPQEAERTLVLRVAEGLAVESFPALEPAPGEIGVVVGGLAPHPAWRELLSAAGWTVVNIGWTDAGSPLGLSANVRGAERAYLVREAAGRRIAFIGAAAPPQGRRVEGIGDPREGVVRALAEAKAAGRADIAILVAHMSRAQAAALLREAPGFALAVVSGRGGADPEPLRLGEAWMAQAPGPGPAWARIEARFDAAGGIAAVASSFGAPEGRPSAKVAEVLRRLEGTDPIDDLLATAGDAPAPARSAAAAALEASNRACRLRVRSWAERAAYGPRAAGPGRRLIVVDAEFENTIPLALVQRNEVPTEYRVPELGDHLYAVIDGVRVARLARDAASLPGHVPVRPFSIERPGERVRGSLVFETAAAETRSLELRFYDFAHGHMALALAGGAPGVAAPEPIAPLERNEILEMGVFGLEMAKRFAGEEAPAGMVHAVLDLRARSLMTLEADATAFDPKAEPGAKLPLGTVADWKDSRRHLQMVIDGEYGAAPLEASPLAPEPRFLPDAMTGDAVAFLVPENVTSLELRCDFPNAAVSGSDRLLHPRGFTIPLRGRRPAIADRPALAAIDDDIFQVAVTAQAVAAEHAGVKAAAGEKLLLLEARVRNAGEKGEFFQPREQLKVAASSGAQLPAVEGPAGDHRAPPPLLWIPAGEMRSLRLTYRLPRAESRPRLAYSGVSLAKVLDLAPPEAAPDAAAAPAGPPPRKETEKPQAPAAGAPAPEAPAPPRPPVAAAPRAPQAPEAPQAPQAPRPEPPQPPPAPQVPRTPREPQGLAGVGLTAEQVNRAIDRGAAFLWSYLQKEDLAGGRKLGSDNEHSLACLALVHAEAHRKYPDFDRALREYLAALEPRRLGNVYEIGLVCMLVESYGDAAYLPAIREAIRYLVQAQGPEGSWTYKTAVAEAHFRDPAAERLLQVSGGVPLDAAEKGPAPIERLPAEKEEGADGDNSVTQYAVLGLHASSRAGVEVGAGVWSKNIDSFEKRQARDGGWAYHGATHEGYGSMTCAGICALAIDRHELGEAEILGNPSIRRGLDWLAKNFSVDSHPGSREWHYYYLYSLERVGRVLNADFIGEHEWYPLGARYLVAGQKEDGRWVGSGTEGDPRLATSFALLFLTRATPTLKSQELNRGGSGVLKTAIRLPKGSRYYFILDASGSMTAPMGDRTKWEVARDAVALLVSELPDGSEVGLRVYGHQKTAIDPGASEDTALEVPLRPLDRKAFGAKLSSLRPRGKTPLALSLLEARRDLGGASPENPVTVVLLTDGGEDTLPRQNPLSAAEEFGKLDGIKLHVVGFDIDREDWSVQLQGIAGLAGGRYWPAHRTGSLDAELRSAVFGAPSGFTVLDPAGREVARGKFGRDQTLPEGKYLLRTSLGGIDLEESFWINTEATTAVVFNAARAVEAGALAGAAGAAKDRPAGAGAPGTPGAAGKKPAEPAPAAKFCTGCGAPLRPAAKFCTGCGKKI